MAFCSSNAKAKASTSRGMNQDHKNSLDRKPVKIKSSSFKRQISAPVQSGQGVFARQISAPVSASPPRYGEEDSDEPDREPGLDDEEDSDVDHFESMPAPSRQISVMSSFSAKAPSRQVTTMSSFSGIDWESLGASGFKRQETEERWPVWIGMMPPHAQSKLEDLSDQLPHGRKRESLIDLAKMQQEQESRNHGSSRTLSEIKFCRWCGNKCQPSFQFCVFCGNAVR